MLFPRSLLSCLLMLAAVSIQAQSNTEEVDHQNLVPFTQKRNRRISCFFTGEWLYWNTRQGGMQYATRYNPIEGDMADAQTKNVEFGWHSGWRCGGGCNFGCDRWHLYFSYTLFQPGANSSINGVLFPYLMYQGNNLVQATVVDAARAQWSMDFKTWNVEIGRKCPLSDSFALRAYAGLKGAGIDQQAQIQYTGGPVTPPGGEYNINLDQKFSGFGVRGGLDSIWTLGAGFSFAGNLSSALLWGTFDTHQNQTLLTLPLIDWRDSIKAMAPMIQALIKGSWDHCFFNNRFHLGIQASLETQYWWQQNIVERFVDTFFPISVNTREDLGFYGFSLGGRIDF